MPAPLDLEPKSWILIVGTGSSALHFARACEDLQVPYAIRPVSQTSTEEFRRRYLHRYGARTSKMKPAAQLLSQRPWSVSIAATPPFMHPTNVLSLDEERRGVGGQGIIFIDKPPFLSSIKTIPDLVTSASQHTWLKSWRLFIDRAQTQLAEDQVVRIDSQFIESLNFSTMAHPWNQQHLTNWVRDATLGGGALNEFCHPLFWLAQFCSVVMGQLPSVELTHQSWIQNGETEFSNSAKLEGFVHHAEIAITQTMLPANESKSVKNFTVTFGSGNSINWSPHQLPAEVDGRVMLLKWLLDASQSRIQEPLEENRRQWMWVDSRLSSSSPSC